MQQYQVDGSLDYIVNKLQKGLQIKYFLETFK